MRGSGQRHLRGRRAGRRRSARQRRRLGPRDRRARELDADHEAQARELRLVGDRDRAPPDQRADRVVAVDVQRIRAQLEGLLGAPEALDSHQRARPRESNLDPRPLGVEAVEHDPLVAVQELAALICGRAVEIRPVEAARDRGEGAIDVLAARLSEEPAPDPPVARERPEACCERWVGGIDDVRRGEVRLLARREPDADGVCIPPRAAERALVDDWHLQERRRAAPASIAVNMKRFVDERGIAKHAEPR